MTRTFYVLGAVFAGSAVAAGALGAHSLERMISPERLSSFETGVRYQMYHALGLLAVGWAIWRWGQAKRILTAGGWFFVVGIVLFSGSLFSLALGGPRWLGAITPIGGIALLLGWLALSIAPFRG